MVKRPSRSSGSGWETLSEVRKWSRDPLGVPEVVGRPSRRFGSGRKTLPKFRKWSGDPPKGPKVIDDYPGGV